MSTLLALLAGTAAAGGAAVWAGSSTSTIVPKSLEEVKESIEESVKSPSEPSTPKELPSTPPEPVSEPVSVPESVPEPVPESEPIVESPVIEPAVANESIAESTAETPVVQGGGSKQDGGFGKPTWAPLNSGVSLQSTLGSTGSSLLSKWTGEKTPESIQLKLKEIDDELRVLKVQKFNTESEIQKSTEEMQKDPTNENDTVVDPSNNLRGRFIQYYNSYLRNKTLYDYNSKLISKIVDEKKDDNVDERTLKEQYKEKFPEKASDFDNYNERDNLFKFIKSKNNELPDNLKIKDKLKNDKQNSPDVWWGTLKSKSSSGNSSNDPSKLDKYLTDREKAYKGYVEAEDEMNKYKDKYEELDSLIKDLKLKLSETNKKIKELIETRKLVLIELSNFQLPKGIFESLVKQRIPVKPSLLPTGQERDKLFAQIKVIERKLKNIEEELNNEIDLQLNKNPKWKPTTDKKDIYGILKKKQNKLEFERDNLILELEGRSETQKQLLDSYNNRKIEKEIQEQNPIEQANKAKKEAKELKQNIQKAVQENREKIELEEKAKNLKKIESEQQIELNKEKEKQELLEKSVKEKPLEQIEEQQPIAVEPIKKSQVVKQQQPKQLLELPTIKKTETIPTSKESPSSEELEVQSVEQSEKLLINNLNETSKIKFPQLDKAFTDFNDNYKDINNELEKIKSKLDLIDEQNKLKKLLENINLQLKITLINSDIFKKEIDPLYKKFLESNSNFINDPNTKSIYIQNIETFITRINIFIINLNSLQKKGGYLSHLTRKQHWTRSKPSRFKTHRIY